ncbi:hypothetical protein Pint_17678 [Pistacia integerrima]|uniref:Uncharacterized protein n=4 Tax=Pistacia TaxID=55512 RepID=A0ACC1BXX4_9ROSI|nr:hypothetical protein Pint_12016 [Pistacia integerrima]KAJ0034205.1 hypothetical protein Pint_25088 [Pistacia integerrima]KAJ0042770.1 hypothetical protein Pint_17678 [Pistacia integerrima]KAJ0104684.1 hypothetical protein Patl1_19295 [Pistacia atlantica]
MEEEVILVLYCITKL